MGSGQDPWVFEDLAHGYTIPAIDWAWRIPITNWPTDFKDLRMQRDPRYCSATLIRWAHGGNA